MSDNISILDATANAVDLKTTDTGTGHTPHHVVTSSALPTGAATSAKQDTLLAAVATAAKQDTLLAAVALESTAQNILTDMATETTLAGVALETTAQSILAKQPALGTAGTASADVISVQGIASGTPVAVSGDVGFAAFPAISKDAFGRLRTSDPGYRFDSQFTYGVDADLWDSLATGGTPGTITHDATERWVELEASVSGAGAVLQSHYHSPYTPGRGQLAFITFLFGATPGTGGVRKVGYWDGSNGIYLTQTPAAVSLVLASDTSKGDETVAQAAWNIDPMDGNGPSGMTLDLETMQILVIQLQALYVGRVTVGFDIGGTIIPVHAFDCANYEALPYFQQASLPVRYEVATSDASTAMYAVCASVISEGGNHLSDLSGRQFAAYGILANVASVLPAVIIRQKETLNSITQNSVALPSDVDIAVSDAGVWVEIRRNPTITAGTFEDVLATKSTMEMSWAGNSGTDPAITASTGVLLDKFYVPASATIKSSRTGGLAGKAILAYSHLLGVGDSLAIVIDPGAGTTADVWASVKWKEIR